MANRRKLLVKISEQKLYLLDEQDEVIKQYPVSTSRYGVGNQQGSYKTPTGRHCIREKIGDAAAEMTVFIGRQPQGVLHELQQSQAQIPEDIITSRILWLQGMEPGVNQGGDIDSYQRYIYIHGTDEEDSIGTPASHGCIRMCNKDVIELYDLVDIDSEVMIQE